ncbi:MAG: RNA polymerase sigma factor [Planctomycetaceae bacterium]
MPNGGESEKIDAAQKINPPAGASVPMSAARDRDRSAADPVTNADDARIDPAVVASLYQEHAKELRAFLIGLLRDGDLAGEALQAAFAKCVEVGHTAREETRKGWLFRVAYNEAMLIRRRRKRQEKSIGQLVDATSREDRPENRLVRNETVERVRLALERLPAEQRQVVRMRIYEDKTFAAIAAEIGAPLGTVLTRMRLALKKLEEHFHADEA